MQLSGPIVVLSIRRNRHVRCESRTQGDVRCRGGRGLSHGVDDPGSRCGCGLYETGTIITFTGGREFDHPRGPTDFNARRYRWVKKQMDRFDVCPGADETVVYSIGTLYGEWIDGTPFEGNRYVDRFVVKGGQIVKMDVWNDSAERILVQMGIEE
jgi:hypothetical protein